MGIFLSSLDAVVPDPRADNGFHDLCELLVVACGDRCLTRKANEEPLLPGARSYLVKGDPDHPAICQDEAGHGGKEFRSGTVGAAKGAGRTSSFSWTESLRPDREPP